MSIPRSARRSSTFLRLSGYFTYSSTARRITSGELLKQRKGLAGWRGRGMKAPLPSHPYGAFALTTPSGPLIQKHRHAFDPHQFGAIEHGVIEVRHVDGLLALLQGSDRYVAIIAVLQCNHARSFLARNQLHREGAKGETHHPVHRVGFARAHQIRELLDH